MLLNNYRAKKIIPGTAIAICCDLMRIHPCLSLIEIKNFPVTLSQLGFESHTGSESIDGNSSIFLFNKKVVSHIDKV